MHFAFVSMPGHGHVNPTLPLVEELVSRGHRLTYITHPTFAHAVESAGATLLPGGGDPLVPPSQFDPEEMARLVEQSINKARGEFPSLTEQLRQDPVDAVCYDVMSFIGPMLGEKLAVPSIELHPTHASNEHFSLREEVMEPNLAEHYPAMLETFEKIQQLAADFAAEQGVRNHKFMEAPPAEANIVFLPRAFQFAGDTFDERFHFVGPALGTREFDKSWQPADDSKPLLFISLGTAFNQRPEFFRMCLEAFGDGQWQVAMAIGDNVDPAELGPVPDNIEIRPYFPQPRVLRHADVFLSHTGMNSTMESLFCRVPLVAVPQQPEQVANARQVETLGLGRRLDPAEVTPELLRSTVAKVSADENIRSELATMSEALHDAGGPTAAADAIEAHLRRRGTSGATG